METVAISLSRRSFAAGSLTTILGGPALFAGLPVPIASAQGMDLSDLGFPTLDITMTDSGFEGVPDEIEAGRYLVTIAVPESLESGGGDFLMPPADMTAQQFLEAVGLAGEAPSMGSPPVVGSPEASKEGPPDEMVPAEIFRATWVGGAVGPGGMPAQSVIDLQEGEWILLGDDPFGTQAPLVFTVSGGFPEDLAEPQADIMVSFIEFAINVDGALTSGDHILHVENLGAQPHFVYVAKGPDAMTNEDVAVVLQSVMPGAATPESLPFDPDADLIPVLSTAAQSMGTVQWVPATFEAGTYAGFCFFPNAGEGMPHAYHGMHTVFTVE